MNNKMLVSFIVPTLNQADFLNRCLDSCLTQTIPNFEVVVQDGGSKDGSLDILRTYGNSVDWVSEPDSGQSDAINKAIDRCNGEVIAWINSDDYYPTDRVAETICTAFDSDAELDIVYGDGLFIDTSEKPLRKFSSFQFSNPRQTLIQRPTSPVAQPALFFKRKLFVRVGKLREDLHWAMDHELWFRMFSAARRWKYIPEVFAHQTFHPDAKSIRGMKTQFREIQKIKIDFLKLNQGSWTEYFHVYKSVLNFHAYHFATKTGLINFYWNVLKK